MDVPAMPSSSRILFDVPCIVCGDHSSGKHYGVYACDGCAGFFKRSVRRQRNYTCKARQPRRCLIDKMHRNQCRSCRLEKCLDVGMNRDAVQHERGPRNATIRRQMALYMNDRSPSREIPFPVRPVPEFNVPKRALLPPPPPPLNLFNPYVFNRRSLLNPTIMPFTSNLPSPPETSGLAIIANDPGALCEAAAKVLFMNVKWCKGVSVFGDLSIEDRQFLLADTWKDLFVLGAAQFLYPMNVNVLLNRVNDRNTRDVELFKLAMAEVAHMRPDATEYTCLRGIVLFNSSSHERLEDESRPQNEMGRKRLQELKSVADELTRNKMILTEYAALIHPLEVSRPNQLLQLLSIIRRVSSEAIVDLFFRATIKNISMERIICDMYKTA